MKSENYSLCIVVLVFCLGFVGCGSEPEELKSSDAAPGFSLPVLENGQMAHFPEDYSGKVVALRFWADWCPYCDHEMQDLEPIYIKYKDRGLRILALNVQQDRATASKFAKRLNITYDILLDIQGTIAGEYQIIGLPTTYIIDRKGQIHTRIVGESTAELFESIVSNLLSVK